MSVNPGLWIKNFLAGEKSSNAGQHPVANKNPAGFTYPAGEAPFELLFRHNPILYSLLPLLSTPSLVSVFFVSSSTKSLLADMTPFFRNLVFVPESNPVKWVQNEAFDHPHKGVPSPLKRAFVDFREQREREKIDAIEAREMIFRYMSDTLNGTNIVSEQLLTKKYKSVRYHYYRRLRGRHLCKMIETFPVGRRLTTLIIDGTGVDTDSLKFALSTMEGTLRGVSAKWCKHIECYMWSEWILETMDKTTPFVLQWLNVYGSGNTPLSDFRWDEYPDQLTPLRPHPNDPKIPREIPEALSDWKPKPNLFANLIPFEIHYDYTMALLTPQNLSTQSSWSFLHANRQAIGSQREAFLQSHPRPAFWDPPQNSTLCDPHPLIALLAVAKFKRIELDISYCMNGRRCYSFLYNRPTFMDVNQIIPDNPPIVVTVSDTLGGNPRRFTSAADSWGDEIKLHTHCVAEVGKRREDGGGACVNCGMWEDKLAEKKHRGTSPMRNVGGVLTGDTIGVGRISVGNLCLECTTNMTCVSCNAFYCNSCLFRSVPALARVPTAMEPPDPEFLQMICTRSTHGPYCQNCVDKHTDTCADCDEKVCKECLTPDGLAISTNIFGRTLDLGASYGVTYGAWQERAASYGGWDEMLLEETSTQSDFYETDSDSETDGGISSRGSPDHYEDEDMEELIYPHQLVLRRESEEGSARGSSSSTRLPTSSFGERGKPPFFPTQDPGSELRRFSVSPRIDPLTHDPRMILSTRITEKCGGCDDLLCSFCLNYDAKPNADIYEAAEYQSCAGGCGLRICKSCLHGDEFVMVWCYEKCGAWLCSLCTYGKRDVTFVCHPAGRGERWGWGSGEFLPFMWWSCRHLGILGCSVEHEAEHGGESGDDDDDEPGEAYESKGGGKLEALPFNRKRGWAMD